MDPIAGPRWVRKGVGAAVDGVGISEKLTRCNAERGGIMTICRAASVVG